MDYFYYYNKVIEEFSSDLYREELMSAKNSFFQYVGSPILDDNLKSDKFKLFLDFYIYERPLREYGVSPIAYYYKLYKDKFNDSERLIYKHMTNTVCSIFSLEKVKGDFSTVRDLFSDKTYLVKSLFLNEQKGYLFQARLVFFGDYYISYVFCIHSPEVSQIIKEDIRKIKYLDRDKWISYIYKICLLSDKSKAYPHIKIDSIYRGL